MPTERLHKKKLVNARDVQVDFNPNVRDAFRDLAAALHASEHASPEMLQTLQQWAGDKKPSIEQVLMWLPSVAEETFNHLHATIPKDRLPHEPETGDKQVMQAWEKVDRALADAGNEAGFTLLQQSKAINGRSVTVDFDPNVRKAFRDLATVLEAGHCASYETVLTMQEWAEGMKPSVEQVLMWLPVIAEETFGEMLGPTEKYAPADKKKVLPAWKEFDRAFKDAGSSAEGVTLRLHPRQTDQSRTR